MSKSPAPRARDDAAAANTKSPTTAADSLPRCHWANAHPLLRRYHDQEWGRPEYEARALWEKLMLDGMQAGLSWLTILRKRPALRVAFAQFDPAAVAQFGDDEVAALLQNVQIIRSRAKIVAVINNARAYLAMQQAGESLADFAWQSVGGKPLRRAATHYTQTTQNAHSTDLAKALRSRGYRFVGPTIVYAWMQACGLIDDHEPHCFRRPS